MDWLKYMATMLKSHDVYMGLAGAAGGIVRSIALREPWKIAIANIVVGVVGAIYLSPAAVPLVKLIFGGFDMADDQLVRTSAFLTGVGAMSIVGGIAEFWKTWKAGKS